MLPALWGLAQQYARRKGLREVEWIVHAVYCARPNLRLRRVLERKGFAVVDRPGSGRVYYLLQRIGEAPTPP